MIIGGLAAEFHGCGWSTLDVDLVIPDGDETNFRALAEALTELEASYFDPAGRIIRPSLSRLVAIRGPQLLVTNAGRVDVLKEAGGETFETLVKDSIEGPDGQVASLEALLRMKRAANRPKDQQGIALIEAALAKQQG